MTKPPSYVVIWQCFVIISAIILVYVLLYLSTSSRVVLFTAEEVFNDGSRDIHRFQEVTYQYRPTVCQSIFRPVELLELAFDDLLVSYGFREPGNDRASWLFSK